MNFDIRDPKCDVEALFIEFLKYYSMFIIHRNDSLDIIDKFVVWQWVNEVDNMSSEITEKICKELLSAWCQAGYIKPKKKKYFNDSDPLSGYIFTTRGFKIKRLQEKK